MKQGTLSSRTARRLLLPLTCIVARTFIFIRRTERGHTFIYIVGGKYVRSCIQLQVASDDSSCLLQL